MNISLKVSLQMVGVLIAAIVVLGCREGRAEFSTIKVDCRGPITYEAVSDSQTLDSPEATATCMSFQDVATMDVRVSQSIDYSVFQVKSPDPTPLWPLVGCTHFDDDGETAEIHPFSSLNSCHLPHLTVLPSPLPVVSVSLGANPVFSNVSFNENFFADGDPGQCGGTGFQSAPIGTWTTPILIDADGRFGGCQHQFGITDPWNSLAGLSMNLNFAPTDDAGQCGSSGDHAIPITTSHLVSDPIRIDTDNRAGGCLETFSLRGRNDIALNIEFLPTADSGQCENAGVATATENSPATFFIDTDDRASGCTQRFRLRQL